MRKEKFYKYLAALEKRNCLSTLLTKDSPGYTLYLVLVVLSILAIFSGIVILSLHNATISVNSDFNKLQARFLAESGGARLVKDLAYFALALASLPFAVAEAACGAGATVMMEARKR